MNETITLSGIVSTLFGVASCIAVVVVVGLGLAHSILPIFIKHMREGYEDATGDHDGEPPAIKKAA